MTESEIAETSISQLQEMADRGYRVTIDHHPHSAWKNTMAYHVTVHTDDDKEIKVIDAPMTMLVDAIESAYRMVMVWEEHLRGKEVTK